MIGRHTLAACLCVALLSGCAEDSQTSESTDSGGLDANTSGALPGKPGEASTPQGSSSDAAPGGSAAGAMDGGAATDAGGDSARSDASAPGRTDAGAGGMSGGAGDGGTSTPGPMSSGCGKAGAMTGTTQATIRAFDLDRSYFLSVPSSYDANVPHRLVFGYHGSNYTGRMMRSYLDLEKAPLMTKTIFVYPDGLPLPNQPDNVAWVLTDGQRDLAFFDALFEQLTSSYCIDRDRVFVNGQSFGALMTNAVGCLRGDKIRAIAAVAGSGPRGTCKEQVAVWLTHGMDDMNVPFASGEASRDFWKRANHCQDMTTTMSGMPMQCLHYSGCDPGYPVIWCPHVNDGGHQHPSFGRAAVRAFLDSF